MKTQPIVALDVGTLVDTMAIVERLGDRCRFYKVGSELFTAEGPTVVRMLTQRGCRVFLDLKLHDIPTTVRGAARSAARLGVQLLTVHATGGRSMMEAAVEGAGPNCGVLAVSVLTSLSADEVAAVWGRESGLELSREVLRLADEAVLAGALGLVCSGHEAPAVRARHRDALKLLVPGVRRAGESTGDQARVVTPRGAAEAGADYLVLGRTITAAADPVTAMDEVLASLR